jgi:hypothetical protein
MSSWLRPPSSRCNILKELLTDHGHHGLHHSEVPRYLNTTRGKEEAGKLAKHETTLLWWTVMGITDEAVAIRAMQNLLEATPSSILVVEPISGYTPVHMLVENHGSNLRQILDQMLLLAPQVAQTRTKKSGEYLLHCAARRGVSSQVLRNIYDRFPDAASLKDFNGNLALHHFFDAGRVVRLLNDIPRQKDNLSCIQFLLDINLDAAKSRDAHDLLLLHAASLSGWFEINPGAALTLLKMVHSAYPDAIQVLMPRSKMSVIGLVCQELSLSEHRGVEHVMFLFEKYPEAAIIRDAEGKMPFQYLETSSSCAAVTEAFLNSVAMQRTLASLADDKGNNFVHLLSMNLDLGGVCSKKDEDSDDRAGMIRQQFLIFDGFVPIVPHLLHFRNDNGELPLHSCLKQPGHHSKTVRAWAVQSLVHAYPTSAVVPDVQSGLYPFMLAAIDRTCDLASTYFLLQRFVGGQSFDFHSLVQSRADY